MGQDWVQCQRMIQHEQDRYEQLKNLATQANIQTRVVDADPAFRTIEQVLRELSILQRKYMLHINPSELDLFIRVLLKLRFKTRGKAKLYALVEELKRYNDYAQQRLAIGYPLQGPRPSWPVPAPHLGFF